MSTKEKAMSPYDWGVGDLVWVGRKAAGYAPLTAPLTVWRSLAAELSPEALAGAFPVGGRFTARGGGGLALAPGGAGDGAVLFRLLLPVGTPVLTDAAAGTAELPGTPTFRVTAMAALEGKYSVEAEYVL